jgi:hypothetical protein
MSDAPSSNDLVRDLTTFLESRMLIIDSERELSQAFLPSEKRVLLDMMKVVEDKRVPREVMTILRDFVKDFMTGALHDNAARKGRMEAYLEILLWLEEWAEPD